jgi:hypothetical protein
MALSPYPEQDPHQRHPMYHRMSKDELTLAVLVTAWMIAAGGLIWCTL